MKRLSPVRIGIILFLVLATAAVIYFWPALVAAFGNSGKKIESKYAGNLYLMQHDYVYAVSLDMEKKGTVLLVKDENNQFDAWEPGNTANRVYATAFMVDRSGIWVTSDYAMTPWLNKNDRKMITDLFMKEFDLQEDQVNVKGYSIGMTLRQMNNGGGSNSEEIICKPLGYSTGVDNQVRFLEKEGNTMANTSREVRFPENINADPEKVYLLGSPDILQSNISFPLRTELTTLEKNSFLESEFGSSTYFNFQETTVKLSEGSPVFNKKGELLGVYSYYNDRSSGNKNIILTPIRKSTDVSEYFRKLKEREMDESFIFLKKEDTTTAPVIKKWVTVSQITNDSLSGTNVSGVTMWESNLLNLESAKLRVQISIKSC